MEISSELFPERTIVLSMGTYSYVSDPDPSVSAAVKFLSNKTIFAAFIVDFLPSFHAIDVCRVKSIMAKYNNRLLAFIYQPSILFDKE